MEIITGVERRRRWSAAEKLRIVAEIEQPGAGIAKIARQYEISRGLLWNWRSQVRRGSLNPIPQSVFVPVQLLGESPGAEPAKRAKPSRSAGPDFAVADCKIEITLPDGTSIRFGHDVSLVTLRRVVTVLRG
jgi:transposase-like protein